MSTSLKHGRAVNPPFLSGSLPVLEAVSLSPYFRRNLPVLENNLFLRTKVIVYENNMGKNSLFPFNIFSGSARDGQVTNFKNVKR